MGANILTMRETLAGGFPANALGNPIQISECLGGGIFCCRVCVFFQLKGEKYWYYNHAHRHYNYRERQSYAQEIAEPVASRFPYHKAYGS